MGGAGSGRQLGQKQVLHCTNKMENLFALSAALVGLQFQADERFDNGFDTGRAFFAPVIHLFGQLNIKQNIDNVEGGNDIIIMENATQIIDNALHLPHQARAFLAERLLESLDSEPDFALSDKWQDEIACRCNEIDSGTVKLAPGDRVFEDAFEALT